MHSGQPPERLDGEVNGGPFAVESPAVGAAAAFSVRVVSVAVIAISFRRCATNGRERRCQTAASASALAATAVRQGTRGGTIHRVLYEEAVTAAGSSSAGGDTGRTKVDVSISVRTILLVTLAVAIAWALTSIANVLLVILVSLFSVAVLSPVVTAMNAASAGAEGCPRPCSCW